MQLLHNPFVVQHDDEGQFPEVTKLGHLMLLNANAESRVSVQFDQAEPIILTAEHASVTVKLMARSIKVEGLDATPGVYLSVARA